MNTIGPLSVSNLPAIEVNGVWRVLGLIPSTEDSLVGFKNFGEEMRGVGASELQEIDLSWRNNRVLDQGVTSSCAGHAACSGFENCYVQAGRNFKAFNPFFIYGLVNGGRDAGAMLSDVLRALTASGVCGQEDLPPNVMFKSQFPAAAFDVAKNYKVENAYHCRNFDEICHALSLGFYTVLGIMVGRDFGQLDSEGVAPVPRSPVGGHALLGVGLKKSSRYGWLIKIQNSWGGNWGMNGFAYLRREHFDLMPPDAFAVQSVTGPGGPPPVVSGGINMSDSVKVGVEQLNAVEASLVNFGFDAGSVEDLINRYGESVLAVVLEALRHGLTKDLVIEILTRLGPLVLELMVNFLNQRNSVSAGSMVVSEEVMLDNSIVEVLLQKLLPKIIDKYGDKLVEILVEAILKYVK